MNISPVMKKHYEHKTPLCPPAKQTQSKPIKPNFCPGFSCVSLVDRAERSNKNLFPASKGFNEQTLIPKAPEFEQDYPCL